MTLFCIPSFERNDLKSVELISFVLLTVVVTIGFLLLQRPPKVVLLVKRLHLHDCCVILIYIMSFTALFRLQFEARKVAL